MNLPIEKCLVLSTGHIEEKTLRFLEKGYPEAEVRSCGHEYGAIVFLVLEKEPEDIEVENSFFQDNDMEELIPIMKLARENECTMINFDQDGERIDSLPLFKW